MDNQRGTARLGLTWVGSAWLNDSFGRQRVTARITRLVRCRKNPLPSLMPIETEKLSRLPKFSCGNPALRVKTACAFVIDNRIRNLGTELGGKFSNSGDLSETHAKNGIRGARTGRLNAR